MKVYLYEEQNDLGETIIVETTEEDILREDFQKWKEQMIAKFGVDSDLITEKNCVLDWCHTHNAWQAPEIEEILNSLPTENWGALLDEFEKKMKEEE